MSVRRKAQRGQKSRQVRRNLGLAPQPDYADPKVHRGCTEKRSYLSKHRARVAISRIRKGLGSEQRPYHCRHCGKYHLATVKMKDATVKEVVVLPPSVEVTTSIPPTRSLAGAEVKQMVKRAQT